MWYVQLRAPRQGFAGSAHVARRDGGRRRGGMRDTHMGNGSTGTQPKLWTFVPSCSQVTIEPEKLSRGVLAKTENNDISRKAP